jgi:hypothetical protein
MGQALEHEVANVVDPHFTVVAKIKRVDPGGAEATPTTGRLVD